MSDIKTKDILAWLDMQRDAVNTEIVYAPQTEKKQYHKHLEIINALAELVQDMTAVEFLEARRKVCDNYRFVLKCDGKCFDRCVRYEHKNPRETVAIMKKWKEERDD